MTTMPNTKNMGYVIGVLYGDGFVNFKDIERGIPRTIGLTTVNSSFRNAFAEALEAWRGPGSVKIIDRTVDKVIAPSGTVYRDVSYCDALLHDQHLITELLQLTGPTQTEAWAINIKDAVERGPEFCDGIIQGLFDSDASFTPTDVGLDIGFGTVSQEGARSTFKLMKIRNYDIRLSSSIKPDRKEFFRIRIRTSDSWIRYAEQIGSRIDYKAKILKDFLHRRQARS
jgi:hypothetical protein